MLAGRGDVGIAAVNGPGAVVVSGAAAAVAAVAGSWRAGVRTRPLRVSHAFHSPLMEPMLDGSPRWRRAGFREPRIPVVSAVTGEVAGPELAPGYWVRHVREPVRFAAAVGACAGRGCRLRGAGARGRCCPRWRAQCAGPARGGGVAWIPVLARARTSRGRRWRRWAGCGYAAWRWTGPAVPGRRRVDLPTYAFQHQRYWLAGSAGRVTRSSWARRRPGTRCWRRRWSCPAGGLVLTGRLSLADHPWLADHAISGRAAAARRALAELAVPAGDQAGCAMARS